MAESIPVAMERRRLERWSDNGSEGDAAAFKASEA
jgi:hypothetical protein